MYADETIAAIATALASSGVGIVRISGSGATSILQSLFRRSRPAAEWRSHVLYSGQLRSSSGQILDSVLAVLMRGPHSYTGEDVVEFHCHGGIELLQQVLTAVFESGARQAQPGEFTKRAFLNGRIDLTRAEAVADVISARTKQAVSLAAGQLSGGISECIGSLRDCCIRLKAYLEAQIDFSEEDFTIDRASLIEQAKACRQVIAKLLQTYRYGKLIREGVRVVIVGRPNVGKSSLLNALLGEDRAIVTPIAGTTRDTIEESIDVDGVPVVFIDTAGIRSHQDAEEVERIGIQRTTEALASADLALVVLDVSQPLSEEDRLVLSATNEVRRLVVLNKVDLSPVLDERALELGPMARASAKHRQGLEDLCGRIVQVVAGLPPSTDSLVLSRARHAMSLEKADLSLELAVQSIHSAQPPDVIAVDVQDALDYLDEITGAVTNEDVLDRIFSEFCVGK